MTDQTSLTTDRLAELIAARQQVLELLLGLARRQLELASAGDMSDVLKLLAAKQTVLGQLQQLERKLDPFRGQDPEARAWPTAADRRRCQAASQRCDDLLAETMQLERQGEAAMVHRRDAAASALTGLHVAADVHSAYTAAPAAADATQLHCEG